MTQPLRKTQIKIIRVCLVGVKTGRMKNMERKIGWKMLFSTVWLRKKNRRDRKQGRKFSLRSPLFLSSQIGRKMRREKCCEIYFIFYTNTLSPIPHFIHDLMTFASSHSYHFTFSQHSNVLLFLAAKQRFCGLNVV